MSVGELFDDMVETAAGLAVDRHLVFDWELVETAWNGPAVRAAIARREAAFGPDRWPTAVLSNHDQPRHATRLAASAGAADVDAVVRAAAVLLLTLRGTPFLYYGEELGLGDVDVPAIESVDPPAARAGPDFAWWDRSRSRTPMPWKPGPGAGFTSGQPWLRLGPDAATRNVSVQAAAPGSILSFYRQLIALRAATPALQTGTLELDPAADGDVVVYAREAAGQRLLVVLNLGRVPAVWLLPEPAGSDRWRLLLATAAGPHADAELDAGSLLEIGVDEAVILERSS